MYISRKDGTVLKLFKHIGEVKLFDYILTNCNRQTLRWTISKSIREDASVKCDLSEPSINRYLAAMVNEYKVLKKIDRGTYEINRDYIDSNLETT